MVNCWAVGCSKRSEHGFSLHCFPKDTARCLLWIKNVRRIDPESSASSGPKLLMPTKSARICENHFEARCYTYLPDGRKSLKSDAVPTIFPHLPPPTPREMRTEKRHHVKEECTPDPQPAQPPPPSSQLIQAELKRRIDELTKKNSLLLNKLKQAQHQRRLCELKLRQHQSSLSKMFNEDQLAAMGRRHGTRGLAWSTNTLNKSTRLWISLGAKGYNELLKQGMPFPAIRTLQKFRQFQEGGKLTELVNKSQQDRDLSPDKELEADMESDIDMELLLGSELNDDNLEVNENLELANKFVTEKQSEINEVDTELEEGETRESQLEKEMDREVDIDKLFDTAEDLHAKLDLNVESIKMTESPIAKKAELSFNKEIESNQETMRHSPISTKLTDRVDNESQLSLQMNSEPQQILVLPPGLVLLNTLPQSTQIQVVSQPTVLSNHWMTKTGGEAMDGVQQTTELSQPT